MSFTIRSASQAESDVGQLEDYWFALGPCCLTQGRWCPSPTSLVHLCGLTWKNSASRKGTCSMSTQLAGDGGLF